MTKSDNGIRAADPVDPLSLIGMELPGLTTIVDRIGLRSFATAIGESDPVYSDVAAARADGYPDVLVPPTYLFSLEFQRPDPYRVLRMLGADLQQALHGEQRFTYHTLAFAGDELTFRPYIGDYYEKKNGALRFIVRDTTVTRGDTVIAELRNVLVVREPGGLS